MMAGSSCPPSSVIKPLHPHPLLQSELERLVIGPNREADRDNHPFGVSRFH